MSCSVSPPATGRLALDTPGFGRAVDGYTWHGRRAAAPEQCRKLAAFIGVPGKGVRDGRLVAYHVLARLCQPGPPRSEAEDHERRSAATPWRLQHQRFTAS